MLITLVRHGETDWNRERRLQGATDIPLNATGKEQARAAGRSLRAVAQGAFLASSDLDRAVETATLIGAETGIGAPRRYAGIRERSYGDAEGALIDELPSRVGIRGAETDDSLDERVLRALADIAEDAESSGASRAIVVSHGGVIGHLLRRATGGAVPAPGRRIRNGSAHTFSWDAGVLSVVESELAAPSGSVGDHAVSDIAAI